MIVFPLYFFTYMEMTLSQVRNKNIYLWTFFSGPYSFSHLNALLLGREGKNIILIEVSYTEGSVSCFFVLNFNFECFMRQQNQDCRTH